MHQQAPSSLRVLPWLCSAFNLQMITHIFTIEIAQSIVKNKKYVDLPISIFKVQAIVCQELSSVNAFFTYFTVHIFYIQKDKYILLAPLDITNTMYTSLFA